MSKTAERPGRRSEGRVERLRSYFKETRAEIGRVTWPTREQAARLTGIVLAVTVALAAFLALVDYLFAWFVSLVLAFNPVAMAVAALAAVAAIAWWAVARRRPA